MPRLRPAILALVLSLAAPTGAHGLTATAVYQQTNPAQKGDRYYPDTPPTDVYEVRTSDPDGAADRLEVDPRGRLRGPTLVAGAGCAPDADGWVSCPGTPTAPGHETRTSLRLDTGAGADDVTITADYSLSGTVDLGPGDDAVTTSGAVGLGVRGGDGADRLAAGVSAGIVVTWDGGPGPDRVSGRGASVTYAGRTAAVRVTPDGVADDGEPGEGDDVGADVGEITGGDGGDVLQEATSTVHGGPGDDTLLGGTVAGFHQLRGEAGNDTLLGGALDERLDGGEGDDRVDGGPGRDILIGGLGADHLSGGEGDDAASLEEDGAPDVYEGGPGDDAFSELGWNGTSSITLDGAADDGPLGERDEVRPGWEAVGLVETGRITGSAAAETLTLEAGGRADGAGGDDVLTGFGTLVGGPGHDVLRPASDPRVVRDRRIPVADARDGAGGDRIECFAPRVTLRRDRGDRTRGCAGRPVVDLTVPSGALTLRTGVRVSLGMACFGGRACRGTLWLRAGGRRVGQASFRVVGLGRHVVVPVRRAGRAACGTARATVRLRDHEGRRFVQDLRLGRCAWG